MATAEEETHAPHPACLLNDQHAVDFGYTGGGKQTPSVGHLPAVIAHELVLVYAHLEYDPMAFEKAEPVLANEPRSPSRSLVSELSALAKTCHTIGKPIPR